MTRTDKFSSLDELKSAEPSSSYREYAIHRNSWLTVAAPHGGSIELFTTEIAEAIAGNEHNLFVFEGVRSPGEELHITSTRFSSALLTGLQTSENSRVTLAIHGAWDTEQSIIYIGGQNAKLRMLTQTELDLRNFLSIDAALNGPRKYAGMEPENLVNRSKENGIQLEISRALRLELHDSPMRMKHFLIAIRCAITKFHHTFASNN